MFDRGSAGDKPDATGPNVARFLMALPQLDGERFLTDGGIETMLLFLEPRGHVGRRLEPLTSAGEARVYHRSPVETFAATAADMVFRPRA